MNVAALIKQLEQCPPGMEVVVDYGAEPLFPVYYAMTATDHVMQRQVVILGTEADDD